MMMMVKNRFSNALQLKQSQQLLKIDTSTLIYFISILSYGVIFWGNSIESKRVFNIQKKIIRIMASVKRDSLAENYLRN
jgi:hypothetical protein